MGTVISILDFYAEQPDEVWQNAADVLNAYIGGPGITAETLKSWKSGTVQPLNIDLHTIISAFKEAMDYDHAL